MEKELDSELSKYTNEIHGMKRTQHMTMEDSDGKVTTVIKDGEFTNEGNELFGFTTKLTESQLVKLMKLLKIN